MPVIEYAVVERNFTPTVSGVEDVVDDAGVREAGKILTAAAVVKWEVNAVDGSPSLRVAATDGELTTSEAPTSDKPTKVRSNEAMLILTFTANPQVCLQASTYVDDCVPNAQCPSRSLVHPSPWGKGGRVPTFSSPTESLSPTIRHHWSATIDPAGSWRYVAPMPTGRVSTVDHVPSSAVVQAVAAVDDHSHG